MGIKEGTELVAHLESKPADPLSPGEFVAEIVELLGNTEDLEGDEARITAKLMEKVQEAANARIDAGYASYGEPFQMRLMVRDPEDGETTMFVNAAHVVVNEDSSISFKANSEGFHFGYNISTEAEIENGELGKFANTIYQNMQEQYGSEAIKEFAGDNTHQFTVAPMTTGM